MPEYRRSFCEPHYHICYDVSRTETLRQRRVERLADLETIPSGKPFPVTKW